MLACLSRMTILSVGPIPFFMVHYHLFPLGLRSTAPDLKFRMKRREVGIKPPQPSVYLLCLYTYSALHLLSEFAVFGFPLYSAIPVYQAVVEP